MKKVLTVFGTRPEAIKMCPLILELNKTPGMTCKVCLTGQHKEMLDQVMEAFELKEDYNLAIMRKSQTLSSITASVLTELGPVLEAEAPDIVLVHGDTTTSMAAALAAFYRQIPVGHVEAGLRTGNKYSPFPEEMNRTLTGRIADWHFAPTEGNRRNLEREGIHSNIFVVGNTVIDAFQTTVKPNYTFHLAQLNAIDYDRQRVVLVTAHRRENLGAPLEHICNAIRELAARNRDLLFVYPVHLNPKVRETVNGILGGRERIVLTEPVDVFDMHNLLARCYMVMTDSGGLQEEAPAFGKPVLVMRTETERPEAVEAGTVRLVGVVQEDIYRTADLLLKDQTAYAKMAHGVNPYGDGHSSERIAGILRKRLKMKSKR
ncbi:MAG: UDP-N-acetylglucosamine 2-epimerase (non-hydrolyzing) [Muribaculum sp.]|nr:UDP-N-acetylglucosamine 2-epimerase (non-hydrolyzing) [Muribaculum sp.]